MGKYRSFRQHLDPAVGPKRLLALDGGGLRGMLSVQVLRRIEALLRERHGDPQLVLADYFDLIGGTSTGAIIAAGLALGMTVDEIEGHYRTLGGTVFKPSFWRRGLVVPKYDAELVGKALREVFGRRLLKSADLKTGLFVMSKRYDTGSPWPLTNHPQSRYFAERKGSTTIPNGEYPLWQVVRASTAAPMFFAPEAIQISRDDPERGLEAVHGQFLDGGVSTANNPALQMLKTVTMKGYAFEWRTGPDELLMVSVGTGKANPAPGPTSGFESAAAAQAVLALKSLMDDCSDQVEATMQWLSVSDTAREIDREMGVGGPVLGGQPQLRYQRYNVIFEKAWCRQHLGQNYGESFLRAMEAMDDPAQLDDLARIGKLAAERFVDGAHFPPAFDLPRD
jgi:hypothetical protein